MDSAHATWAKELDRKTVEAAIHPIAATEFTTVVCKYPPAFESYELIEVKVTVSPPQQEWVILVTVSYRVWKIGKKEKVHTRAT